MNWSSLSDFFEMGGYALYVWGAFGITALAVCIEVAQVRWARKSLRTGGFR
ncbi:hypothetical protein BH11PSE13_BH11PSE13_36410 [soil metagenome]